MKLSLRLAAATLLAVAVSLALPSAAEWPDDIFAAGHQAKDHPGDKYRIGNYEYFRHMKPPTSTWVDREKAFFTDVLMEEKAHVDTFVVPVQIDGGGFDVATRSAMTLALWRALGGEAPGADPYAVQRALGEGSRALEPGPVSAMGGRSGASRLLFTYVGHEDGKVMHVTAQAWRRTSGRISWTPEPELEIAVPLDDAHLPADLFMSQALPRIVEMMGARAAPKTAAATVPDAIPVTISETLDMGRRNPSSRAAIYQLLGALAPGAPARARERAFEQSLVLIGADDAPLARVMRARAAYYLHSRTAALAALGDLATPEADALRAIANGNLPQAQEATGRIRGEWMRFCAEIELRSLQKAYLVPVEDGLPEWMAAFLQKHREWSPLVVLRLERRGRIADEGNVQLKILLESVQPVRGRSVKQVAEGMSAIGKDIDLAELGRSTFDHVHDARKSAKLREQCAGFESSCPRNAFLDLVEASAIANAIDEIGYTSKFQSANDRAKALLQEWNPLLEGQPDFEATYARVVVQDARTNPAHANDVLTEAKRHANVAFYFEHGASRTAWNVSRLGPNVQMYALDVLYQHDLPVREYYLGGGLDGPWLAEVLRQRLAQATSNIQPFRVESVASTTDATRAAALHEEVSRRFAGNPAHSDVIAALEKKLAATAGKAPDQELARLEAGLRERPDLWVNWYQMGYYLVTQGRYDEASKLFRKFPGFGKDAARYNPVGLSNWSCAAGSLFWYRGRFDDARFFLKISADLDTGSDATIDSRAKLYMLDHNFRAAAASLGERASRYNDMIAYSELLSWLFAFDQGKEAWSGFEQLAGQAKPDIWRSAHVGLRLEGRDAKATREWLFSEPARSPDDGGRLVLMEATMLAMVDRKPPSDLAATLRRLEGEGAATFDGHFVTLRKGNGTTGWALPLRRTELRTAPPALKPGDHVASDLVYFAEAYLPLREGRYAEASDRFFAMAQIYPIDGTDSEEGIAYSYALPYYAWASARSGDKHGLEADLAKRNPPRYPAFDQLLAQAAFAAARGEHDKAVERLNRAFDTRPASGRRPVLTSYQWAEMCAWLFDETGKPQYRDLALRMAHTNEVVQPYASWAWALDAKLSPPGKRERALGYALHLDAGSEWIAPIPEAEKQAARKWFSANNPFKEREAQRQRES